MWAESPPPQDESIDVRVYLRMLRRRWWLLASVPFVTIAAGLLVTLSQTPIYEGRTRLFVGQPTITRQDLPLAGTLTQTSLALVKSYAEAIRTRPVAEEVVRRLHLRVLPERLLERISAAPVRDTQIISISYRDPSPRLAQAGADAVAQAFIDTIRRVDVQSSGEPAVQVSVLEPAALPRRPVEPQPLRTLILAGFVGLLLGWGSVVLAERLDSTITERAQAEEAAGLPVLSIVPLMPKQRLPDVSGTPGAEAFRTLASALRFLGASEPVRMVVVTSADAGDGKTTTAFNLARAFAETGSRAALVEADLRKPALARMLKLPVRGGLATYLENPNGRKPPMSPTTLEGLQVMPAGSPPDNPGQLLGGASLQKVADQLVSTHDVVVVDTPPVLAVADALQLARLADAVVLVVRANSSRREHVREAVRVLASVGAPVAGLVLNAAAGRDAYYGYRYYDYAYGERRARRDGERVAPAPSEPETAPAD